MTALEEIKKALEGVGPLKVEFTPDCDEFNSIIAPINDDYDGTFFTVIGCGDKQDKLGGFMAAAVNAVPELLSTLKSLQRENEASEATATRYANEIIELRGELAKTASLLVVQADRADALDAELDSRTRALDEAEAAMKRLRDTLHPFAEAADYYSTGVHRSPAPDALPCGPALIVAHLRAARTALASTGGEHAE